MPALRAPAIVVRHRKMPSSSRHPRLGTGRLERRSSSLRPAPALAVTVHKGVKNSGPKARGLRLVVLSDVARQADVSLTTASRALDPDNDHPVNARTRARVR